MVAGRGDRERHVQRIEERGVGLLIDPHRPVALHVAVPAHRADARPGPADVAPQQQEVDDFADRGHGVLVLREPHGPAHDDALRGHRVSRYGFDLGPCQAGRLEYRSPMQCAQMISQRLEAVAVLGDEYVVEHSARCPVLRLDQQAAERLEHSEVAIHPDGEVAVGKRGAFQQADRRLRVLEREQPGLGQRVDGDDLGTVLLRLLQCREHAGMVGARVLADHEDQIGGVKVFEGDASLADADRLAEREAARLVAHVRAVREVVRTEAAHEQLVGEGGLVAGPTRCVERRRIG